MKCSLTTSKNYIVGLIPAKKYGIEAIGLIAKHQKNLGREMGGEGDGDKKETARLGVIRIGRLLFTLIAD